MWTLVLITFFWLTSSSDNGTVSTISGFSSEQSCKTAGEKFRMMTPRRYFGPDTDKKWHTDQEMKRVYFSYECIEVK